MRVSTGIPDLDEMLGGGFPARSNIAVIGPPGVGKSVLAYHFIGDGLKRGDLCILVYTGKTSDKIIEMMERMGYPAKAGIEKGLLWFVDAWGVSEGKNVIKVDLSELFTISNQIKEVLKKKGKKDVRVFINVISPLLMVTDQDAVYKFVNDLSNALKMVGATTLLSLVEGMHDPRIMAAIEDLCDGVVEMKLDTLGIGTRRALGVREMAETDVSMDLHMFSITDTGIELEHGL